MKKKNEMILPADISYAIRIIASHKFYDDELPIEDGANEEIAYYESLVLQAGIEKSMKALEIEIDGWLNIISKSKRITSGDNPELNFNLRLPANLSTAVKILQIMTGMDLWQILWRGTSHSLDNLVAEGKITDFDLNLLLTQVHLIDKNSPYDNDTINDLS